MQLNNNPYPTGNTLKDFLHIDSGEYEIDGNSKRLDKLEADFNKIQKELDLVQKFDEKSASFMPGTDGELYATDKFGNIRKATFLEELSFKAKSFLSSEPKVYDETIKEFPEITAEVAPSQTKVYQATQNIKSIDKKLLFGLGAILIIMVLKR